MQRVVPQIGGCPLAREPVGPKTHWPEKSFVRKSEIRPRVAGGDSGCELNRTANSLLDEYYSAEVEN